MKYLGLYFFILSILLIVESDHMFFGTNVKRPMVYHNATVNSSNLYYALPSDPHSGPRRIQGVMAYDKTNSSASANVTQGGLGYNFVNIRMKSGSGLKLDYDIYIYA